MVELEALARISEAVSESLYLEESLEAIVKTTMDAVSATGAALVLEDGRIAWPEGRPGSHAVRTPLRWKRRQIGELVADRDSPFTDDERALLEAIAHHAAVALEHGRAVMRGVLAQEIHHRVKNNLQTVASLLRLQARADAVDPQEALEHSVNRILAIAAVHEALTEQREEDVELSELIDRLRSMLVQGLSHSEGGGGRAVEARLEPVSLAGNRATALALVFSELLQNALEHGAGTVTIELSRRADDVVLTIADEGNGAAEAAPGTGLSIVRALVARRAPRDVRAPQRGRHARRGGLPGVRRPEEAFVFVRRGEEFLVLHRAPARRRVLALGRGRARGGRGLSGGGRARAARGDRARRGAGRDRAARTRTPSTSTPPTATASRRAPRRSRCARSSSTRRPAGSRSSTTSTTSTAGASRGEAIELLHWPEPRQILRTLA